MSSTEMGNTGGGNNNEFSFGYIEFELHVDLPVESVN